MDIIPSLQKSIDYQINDDTGYIVYFVGDSIEKLTGIRSLVLDSEQVETLEPIDITGWIPVSRSYELDEDDLPNYQACIITYDLETITRSEIGMINVGFWHEGKVFTKECKEVFDGYFKLITL